MSRRQYSRQDLIDALHELAERLGQTPRERDTYKYADMPTHQVYVKRFGSWRTALQAAGMAVSPRNAGYDRETLVNRLRALAEDLGRTPTCVDLRAVDGPCYDTYRHHFGGWAVALKKAGLEVKPHSRRYNDEELLDILRDLADELGHAPSMAELWDREDLPTPSAYKYRFGRWNDALREAGLAPRYEVSDQEGAD